MVQAFAKKTIKGGFCFTKELHFLSSSRLTVWMNARESAPWAQQSVALLQIVGEGSCAKLHWSTPPYAALNNSTPLLTALHLSVPLNTNQKWSVYHSVPLLQTYISLCRSPYCSKSLHTALCFSTQLCMWLFWLEKPGLLRCRVQGN